MLILVKCTPLHAIRYNFLLESYYITEDKNKYKTSFISYVKNVSRYLIIPRFKCEFIIKSGPFYATQIEILLFKDPMLFAKIN